MSGIRVLAHFNDFRALDGGGDQGLAVQRILRLLDQFDARVRRRVLRREDRAAILIRQGGCFKRSDLLRALDDLALIHANGRAENRHIHHRVRAAERLHRLAGDLTDGFAGNQRLRAVLAGDDLGDAHHIAAHDERRVR